MKKQQQQQQQNKTKQNKQNKQNKNKQTKKKKKKKKKNKTKKKKNIINRTKITEIIKKKKVGTMATYSVAYSVTLVQFLDLKGHGEGEITHKLGDPLLALKHNLKCLTSHKTHTVPDIDFSCLEHTYL